MAIIRNGMRNRLTESATMTDDELLRADKEFVNKVYKDLDSLLKQYKNELPGKVIVTYYYDKYGGTHERNVTLRASTLWKHKNMYGFTAYKVPKTLSINAKYDNLLSISQSTKESILNIFNKDSKDCNYGHIIYNRSTVSRLLPPEGLSKMDNIVKSIRSYLPSFLKYEEK